MSQALKETLHQHCKEQLEERTNRLQQEGRELAESKRKETKSTAGDKHETGRAMVQLEEEKLAGQLADVQQQMAALARVKPRHVNEVAGPGALLKTSMGWFYIAVSLGKVEVEGQSYFVLSGAAPIAQAMRDQQAGAEVHFNDRELTIEEIW